MENAKAQFAERLREAMEAAGYEAKPAVLEREFNTRYWGRAMTLHGVRRWLRGETLPSQEKPFVLAQVPGRPPPTAGGRAVAAFPARGWPRRAASGAPPAA